MFRALTLPKSWIFYLIWFDLQKKKIWKSKGIALHINPEWTPADVSNGKFLPLWRSGVTWRRRSEMDRWSHRRSASVERSQQTELPTLLSSNQHTQRGGIDPPFPSQAGEHPHALLFPLPPSFALPAPLSLPFLFPYPFCWPLSNPNWIWCTSNIKVTHLWHLDGTQSSSPR